jgi:hypothetical protein
MEEVVHLEGELGATTPGLTRKGASLVPAPERDRIHRICDPQRTDAVCDGQAFHALVQYRERSGIDAKLVVIGMTATDQSIADPAIRGSSTSDSRTRSQRFARVAALVGRVHRRSDGRGAGRARVPDTVGQSGRSGRSHRFRAATLEQPHLAPPERCIELRRDAV